MADPPVIDLTSTQPAKSVSSHRLPAVSASQALQGLQQGASSPLKTGIDALDARLSSPGNLTDGGLERGKITELWGPSGAGKTAVALQTAAHTIRDGHTVCWIDAATSLCAARLGRITSNLFMDISKETSMDLLQSFHHVHAPTLSHLLASIIHTRPELVRQNTSLLVIDGLNHLFDIDYPRYQISTSNKTEQQKWQAGRRYVLLGTLVSALSKLAVLNKLAVIITTGCATRIRHDSGLGAALVPGVGGIEWEAGMWNRCVVFRDFGARFVGIQKCQGRSLISREEVGEPGHIMPFEITANGALQNYSTGRPTEGITMQQPRLKPDTAKPRKRIVDEIADSDGEDVDEYGWADTDEDAFTAGSLIGDG